MKMNRFTRPITLGVASVITFGAAYVRADNDDRCERKTRSKWTYSAVPSAPGSSVTNVTFGNNEGSFTGFFVEAETGHNVPFILNRRNRFTACNITLPNTTIAHAIAVGIDDDDGIIGFAFTESFESHAFYHQNRRTTELAYPGSIYTNPVAISSDGTVLGSAGMEDNSIVYFTWTRNRYHTVPQISGFSSYSLVSINSDGDLLGSGTLEGSDELVNFVVESHKCHRSTLTILPAYGLDSETAAVQITDSGAIVGFVRDFSQIDPFSNYPVYAFIFDGAFQFDPHPDAVWGTWNFSVGKNGKCGIYFDADGLDHQFIAR